MKWCVYCGDNRNMSKDHVVPVSHILPGKRKGRMISLGETVDACMECNALLGNKNFHIKSARALYLVERYANRLQFYEKKDQAELLGKIKTAVLAYEGFLLQELEDDEEKKNGQDSELNPLTDDEEDDAPLDDDYEDDPEEQLEKLINKTYITMAEIESIDILTLFGEFKHIDRLPEIINFNCEGVEKNIIEIKEIARNSMKVVIFEDKLQELIGKYEEDIEAIVMAIALCRSVSKNDRRFILNRYMEMM